MHVSWVSLINYHFPLPLLFNPSLAKEAFFTAVHLINCLPTPILNHSSPIGAPLSYHTNYTFLKVYGSLFYPYLQPYNSQKVNIASPCLFLGYGLQHKGYECLHSSA